MPAIRCSILSALVEEAAAAAGSLQEQAGALEDMVSVFRLGTGTPAQPHLRAGAPRPALALQG